MKKTVITIDGRPFTKKKAGIGTFLSDVIINLAKYASEYTIVVLLPHDLHPSFKDLKNIKGVIIQKTPFLTEKIPNIIWFHCFIWHLMKRFDSHILITPHCQYPFFLQKDDTCIITVHDFVYKDFPSTMEWWNRISAELSFERALRKAKKIWCNSDYTYNTMIKYFPFTKNTPHFTGLSVSEKYKKKTITPNEALQLKKSLGIEKDFYLFIGTIEPRKNLQFLLHIAPLLYQKTSTQTLIIGASRWKSQIDISHLGKSVVLVERFLSDDDLVQLYNLATCYISTSLNEGFGMPQLEAMKCGCPVVSPNNSAMTEVVSGYGTLVNGWKEDDWIAAIIEESSKKHIPYYSEKYDWRYLIGKLGIFLKQ